MIGMAASHHFVKSPGGYHHQAPTARISENENVVARWCGFREYPRISENIREFPRISENIREYPRISENIREYPRISENIREYPRISENI
jgi:hypothetical protein